MVINKFNYEAVLIKWIILKPLIDFDIDEICFSKVILSVINTSYNINKKVL